MAKGHAVNLRPSKLYLSMGVLVQLLRARADSLEQLVQKGEFAQATRYARDFAVINKDMASPQALYADSTACCEKRDESAGVSWWILSTPAMDREGDILEPRGCLDELEHFKRNPIVDFDHRRHYPMPVGKSIGLGDDMPLIVGDGWVKAGCRHHGETQFADEVARLVFKGFLNACSVAFMPVLGQKLRAAEKAGITPRYHFLRWQPTAWSIAPVGVNPEAVRCELSRGIKSMELRQSLEPWAEKPTVWSPGWTFQKSLATEVEPMIELAKVDRERVACVRFHKSVYADQSKQLAWLKANAFDASAAELREKSTDYTQVEGEVGEKSDKVEDGVYVVYLKAFPPPKKKKPEDDETDDPKAKKKPPFGKEKDDADAAGDNLVKGKKKPSAGSEDAEVEGRDDNGMDTDDLDPANDDEAAAGLEDEGDESDQDVDDVQPDEGAGLDDPNADPMGADDNPPLGGAQAATKTYAQQTAVDIAKHMHAEVEYLRESLAMHDHDGIKQLAAAALKRSEADMNAWVAACSKMFPNIDFQSEMQNAGDDLGGEDGMDDMGGSMGGADAPPEESLRKSLDSMSEEEWDETLIQIALQGAVN